MDENVIQQHAEKVYATLCSSIENRGWRFEKVESALLVHFGVRGEDFPMNFLIAVDPKLQLVRLFSRLPFKMDEDKRLEGAIITCAATNWLIDGSFDYDISTGEITFRLTESIRESDLGEGVFQYMMDCASFVVDEFNDQFFAVNKGFLSVQDFLNKP